MLMDTSKRILAITLLLSLACFAIGAFFVTDILAYAKGLAFGTIFSVLKWILLERSIKKSLDMAPNAASAYISLHYMLRYLLTGVVLVVSALEPSINLYAAIIGIFIPRPAIFIAGFVYKENI